MPVTNQAPIRAVKSWHRQCPVASWASSPAAFRRQDKEASFWEW